MRAVDVGTFGTVQLREPVFATSLAMTVGKVVPPSVESSIVTFRSNPEVFVHVMFTFEPIATEPFAGETFVIVSGTLSLLLSRYQPISRISCLVRSSVSGSPTLIFGSINRFGLHAVLKC